MKEPLPASKVPLFCAIIGKQEKEQSSNNNVKSFFMSRNIYQGYFSERCFLSGILRILRIPDKVEKILLILPILDFFLDYYVKDFKDKKICFEKSIQSLKSLMSIID
jgi:hypothetical protein